MNPRGFARRVGRPALLALVGLQLVLGLAWTAQNLGTVPEYGDTREYLQLARTLEVDVYRGVAYPLLLAALDRLPGIGGELTFANARSEGGATTGFLVLQILQIAACAAALAYFLRVFAGPRLAGAVRAASIALFLLLLLDPLVAHFNLAVLTDGLALSASLAFCAALSDFALGKRHRLLSGCVLFLTTLVAAGLRAEKSAVLAGTALVALAGWTWLERRLPAERRRLGTKRALQTAAIVAAVTVAISLVASGLRGERGRWPVRETLLHQRVVFPHLAEVYDELPPDVRSVVSRAAAQRHDSHIRTAREVIDKLAGDDARLRKMLIEESAATVLRERWGKTLADVVQDAVENVAATPSFYLRLAFIMTADERELVQLVRTDFSRWTYTRIAQDHPRTSRLYVCTSAALFAIGACLALWSLRRKRPGRSEGAGGLAFAALPVGAFVVLNALAFALAADLTHVRYTLFAHVVLLALVYRGALAWAAPAGEDASVQTTPAA